MCENKDVNDAMNFYEVNQEAYEENQKAMEDYYRAIESGEIDHEYIPTQEEINDALCYDLRDCIDLMSYAQKSYIKALVDKQFQAATPKERLYDEIMELQERITKLDSFIRKRNEDGIRVIETLNLTEAAIHLMTKQLEVEKELNDILVARYSIFDVKKDN